jgi:Na+/H+ antiporter NhaD/arsenite permease-like protein
MPPVGHPGDDLAGHGGDFGLSGQRDHRAAGRAGDAADHRRTQGQAYPYLFAMIFSSNIGGTATLIGDPPNIMIGSATGLTFNDFAYNLAPVIVVVMAATLIPIYFIWGRHLRAAPEDRQRVMQFNEFEAITDWRLLKQCLAR